MAEEILDKSATLQCKHGGSAEPQSSSAHVKIKGKEVILLTDTYSVSGCSHTVPPGVSMPCTTAAWQPGTGSKRVMSKGHPVVLKSSEALCVPNGTGLTVTDTQTRVKAR